MIGLVFFLLIVALSLYVPIKLLTLAVRWLRWGARTAGVGPAANLIFFAVAAYMYPIPLRFIFSAAWNIVSGFVINLSGLLQQQLISIQQSCTAPIETCLNNAPLNLISAWVVFLSGLFGRINLNSFPLLDAILL